jgi:hypothetical protein
MNLAASFGQVDFAGQVPKRQSLSVAIADETQVDSR